MKFEKFPLHLQQYFIQFDLGKSEAEKLIRIGKYKSVRKGERIFLDSPRSLLYLVLNGKLKLFDNGNAGEEDWLFTDILRAGDFIGDITLSGKVVGGQFVEAITNNALICYFYSPDIRQLVNESPCFALKFIASLGKKLKETQEKNLWLISGDTKTRLMIFFQNWAEREGVQIGDKLILTKDMSVVDIASCISASRQTVHLVLRQLCDEKLIEWKRKTIMVYPELWKRRLN